MLKTRVVTAICLLAGLFAALLLLPPGGWLLLCAVVCAAAGWEWGNLARLGVGVRLAFAAALGVACYLVGRAAGLAEGGGATPALLMPIYALGAAFWLFLVPAWLARKWRLGSLPLALATGAVVLLPPALALAHLRLLGPWTLVAVMAVVWVADIGAYFSGRRFGRHKLAPAISPGKTWEGAIGAGLGVLAFGYALALHGGLALPLQAGWPGLAPLLVAYTALSIVGDLFESLLKRQAGIKDSGTLLPGHGGILDRIDSLTSTLPLAGLAALWLAR
jgi:phosphatidate cytidylyltransferase